MFNKNNLIGTDVVFIPTRLLTLLSVSIPQKSWARISRMVRFISTVSKTNTLIYSEFLNHKELNTKF